MGVTQPAGDAAFEDDGAVSDDGLVIGTYLHGIFENENFRNSFLDYLYSRRNLLREQTSRGDGFDELAGAVQGSLDMKKIWRMLDLDA